MSTDPRVNGLRLVVAAMVLLLSGEAAAATPKYCVLFKVRTYARNPQDAMAVKDRYGVYDYWKYFYDCVLFQSFPCPSDRWAACQREAATVRLPQVRDGAPQNNYCQTHGYARLSDAQLFIRKCVAAAQLPAGPTNAPGPSSPPNVAGTWSGGTGTSYTVSQTGSSFAWRSTAPGANESGSGTINGNAIQASWRSNRGSGSVSGTITQVAPDGTAGAIRWSNGDVWSRAQRSDDAGGVTFVNPKIGKYALDACKTWAKDCGKPAADAWCLRKGFKESIRHSAKTNSPPTLIIGSGKVCNKWHCGRITSVTCGKGRGAPAPAQSTAPPASTTCTGIKLFDGVANQPSAKFKRNVDTRLEVETTQWDRTPYRMSSPRRITIRRGRSQRVYLSGDACGDAAWSVDNFLLIQIRGPSPRDLVVGSVHPVRLQGKRLQHVGRTTSAFKAQEIDLAPYVAPNAEVTITVTPFDYGGKAYLSKLFVVVR